MSSARLSASPAVKLGAYGVVLVGLLAGGAAVGAAFGPEPATPSHGTHDTAAPVMSNAPLPAGLAVSQDGYRLQLATTTVPADAPG